MKKIQLFLSTLIIVTYSLAQEVERSKNNFVQTSKKIVMPILKASAISSLAQEVELTKNNFVRKTNPWNILWKQGRLIVAKIQFYRLTFVFL